MKKIEKFVTWLRGGERSGVSGKLVRRTFWIPVRFQAAVLLLLVVVVGWDSLLREMSSGGLALLAGVVAAAAAFELGRIREFAVVENRQRFDEVQDSLGSLSNVALCCFAFAKAARELGEMTDRPSAALGASFVQVVLLFFAWRHLHAVARLASGTNAD